jgi:hypothetical protein
MRIVDFSGNTEIDFPFALIRLHFSVVVIG